MCQHPSENSSQINTPTWIDFGANLAPFWEGLGAKMKPRWHQIAPKIDPKINRKNDHFLDCPKIDFWSILVANWPPIRETNLTIWEHFSVLVPSWAQEPPKRPLGTPKTPPGRLLGPILDDFGLQLNGFESQLERFSIPNLVVETANKPTSQPTSQATNQPTSHLANQSTKQPNTQTSLHQQTNQPNSHLANQSTKQPDIQTSLHQPTKQAINEPSSLPVN